MRNGGKNRLGRSPLRTSLGCEAAHAVVLRPARDPCCGPCYCHHTRLSWQLALSPGGFHLRAYLAKRRSRRREPGCPSLGTADYQGKALGSRSTIRQRSRCCLSCLQAIYVTHPGPGPKPGGCRCIQYRGVDSTRRGKARLWWVFGDFLPTQKVTPAERPWQGRYPYAQISEKNWPSLLEQKNIRKARRKHLLPPGFRLSLAGSSD